MNCLFCGGSLSIDSPRFGFFVSQCENCEQEASGFLSISDLLEQAERDLIDR